MKNQKIFVPISMSVFVIIAAVAVGLFNNNKSSDNTNTETQNTIQSTTTATNSPVAIDLNPGESINPIDANAIKASDVFSYKLLDVRKDTSKLMDKDVNVVLVKLEIENISKWSRTTSVAEIRLSKDSSQTLGNNQNNLKNDVLYPRTKLGIDHGSNGKKLAPGEKQVGYYAFTLDNGTLPDKLFFHVVNLGNPEAEDNVDLSKSLKIANTFVIKQ
jgi:hypothetical protein